MKLPDELTRRVIDQRARVRLGFPPWLALFVRSDVLAITLGRSIYLAPVMIERGERELARIVRHELKHVDQVKRLGLLRFLFIYLRDYFRLRRAGLGSSAAYTALPFEVEARAAELKETPQLESRGDLENPTGVVSSLGSGGTNL